jgi:hypothetical protein
MCAEALDKGEVLKSEADRAWLRQLLHSLRAAEGSIGIAMGGTKAPKAR